MRGNAYSNKGANWSIYGNTTKDVTRGTTTVAPRGESIGKLYRLSLGSGNSKIRYVTFGC